MPGPEPPRSARNRIVRGFGLIEDITYVGLGILLSCVALTLLGASVVQLFHGIGDGSLLGHITDVLDRILLTLLTVELLYTVQVSFREHSITAEPFLLVGLIAAIRRTLLLTAEYGELHDKTDTLLRAFVTELLVLTALILVLVVSLMLLRRAGTVRANRGVGTSES